MSSFPGQMREYRCCSIDRFDGPNLNSTAYFLSHKHSDHMIGLADVNFSYRLASNHHVKLYCSEITKRLLLADKKYVHLAKSLVVIDLNKPTTIDLYSSSTSEVQSQVTVTFLHAEHCLGSVMMLFEGSEGRVLYTGDFRLERNDILAMSALHAGDRPKRLDSLYVDTTFVVPQALYIPSRLESTQAVIRLIEEWITQGREYLIVIKTRARIGYEQLFIDIAEHFSTKVHVNAERQEVYEAVGVLQEFSTKDPSATQIHVCNWQEKRDSRSKLPCGYHPKGEEVKVRRIMVSTMYFTQHVSCEQYVVKTRGNYRVCYSFHSSYGEVRDLVMYLRPRWASPNVQPMNTSWQQIEERLQRFIDMAASSHVPVTDSQPRTLGQQVRRKKRRQTPPSYEDTQTFFLPTPEKLPRKEAATGDKPSIMQNSNNLVWKSVLEDSDGPSSQEVQVIESDAADDVSDYGGSGQDDEALDLEGVSEGNDGAGSDVDLERAMTWDVKDEEVKSTQESFQPIENGSFGSYLAYMSDLSDGEEMPASEHSDMSQPWESVGGGDSSRTRVHSNKAETTVSKGGADCEGNCDLPKTPSPGDGKPRPVDGAHSRGDSQELTLQLETSSTEAEFAMGRSSLDSNVVKGDNMTNCTTDSDIEVVDVTEGEEEETTDDTKFGNQQKLQIRSKDNHDEAESVSSKSLNKQTRSSVSNHIAEDEVDSDETVDMSSSQDRYRHKECETVIRISSVEESSSVGQEHLNTTLDDKMETETGPPPAQLIDLTEDDDEEEWSGVKGYGEEGEDRQGQDGGVEGGGVVDSGQGENGLEEVDVDDDNDVIMGNGEVDFVPEDEEANLYSVALGTVADTDGYSGDTEEEEDKEKPPVKKKGSSMKHQPGQPSNHKASPSVTSNSRSRKLPAQKETAAKKKHINKGQKANGVEDIYKSVVSDGSSESEIRCLAYVAGDGSSTEDESDLNRALREEDEASSSDGTSVVVLSSSASNTDEPVVLPSNKQLGKNKRPRVKSGVCRNDDIEVEVVYSCQGDKASGSIPGVSSDAGITHDAQSDDQCSPRILKKTKRYHDTNSISEKR